VWEVFLDVVERWKSSDILDLFPNHRNDQVDDLDVAQEEDDSMPSGRAQVDFQFLALDECTLVNLTLVAMNG